MLALDFTVDSRLRNTQCLHGMSLQGCIEEKGHFLYIGVGPF